MTPSRTVLSFAAALALSPMVAAPALAKPKPAPAAAQAPVPDIAYTKYVLSNGLTLIVHEDHKAPIVAVNVWYHVGSKDEPFGRSGFAHLFEHLMFNGSENFNDDWFKKLEAVGATDLNGTTNNDRTNYFQNVPTAALDMTLWMESDRMGHLVGAIDRAKLDEQRGVVQNEKRQGENEPYAVAEELVTKATYPDDHPYGHTVIGSMADLDAAKLEDVKDWFKTYYGPSNAVIVLAGDITPEQAKAKVEKYFGDIPSGPPVAHPKAWVNKRSGEQRAVVADRVAQARLYKVWNVPQIGSADYDYLNLLTDILVSDKTSRLYKRMVYDEQIATNVSAYIDGREIGSQFVVELTARPGDDLKAVEKAFDEEMARLLTSGPTAEEVQKVRTLYTSGFVNGLERIGGFGGKSDILAQSQVYRGSPDAWKESMARVQSATPADLQKAGKAWLSDGSYTLEVLPFPNYQAASTGADRKSMPKPGEMQAPKFAQLERGTLSNGMKVVVAPRHDVPLVRFNMMFDAGYAADQGGKPGTASLAMNMLDEGTTSRDSLAISKELALLGASLGTGSNLDYSTVSLSTLKANLDKSLDLYADVILNPSFPQADFDRLKKLQIASIQREKQQPFNAALRVLPVIAYGQGHAYSVPWSGSGMESSVAALSRDDMVGFHKAWLHPNNATLVVVGDTSLAEIMPKLEAEFGAWKQGAAPQKNIGQPAVPAKPVVYLIDKPGALQSVLTATVVAPPKANPDEVAIETMNTVLGGAFTSRLNMNLREDKHWSYGAGSFVRDAKGPRLFIAYAPVQTDKTKESLVEMRKELRDVTKDRIVTADELAMAQSNLTLAMPGQWETSNGVGGAISEMVMYGLADDWFDTYAARIKATTVNDMGRAAQIVRNDNLTWVVVGDRAKIEAGLRELNLGEIRVIDADGNPVK
ncbi:pitrilysin family protein [Caulobacter sp. 17J80-11]|uniref:M16 family metallopeptidase n=1 Tax=Caulobacter sp. 17J80-11 TaxID=2763502 RepID=UPI001653CC2E|nr:pitrilysin family protein [Caulobacter sp. 17J80-11]MBC6983130.1 insulinase family protein [Caulobacter sp. 17J80-11]